MRSIQARYNQFKTKHFDWSSLTCFDEAIRGQNFSEDMVSRWFNKLTNKDDYDKEQRKDILKNMYKANKEVLGKKERHNFIPKYHSK